MQDFWYWVRLSLFCFLTSFFSAFVLLATDVTDVKESRVEVKMFSVGEGGCGIAKFMRPGQTPRFLMYDAGSSSYTNESLCQQIEQKFGSPVRQRATGISAPTPKRPSTHNKYVGLALEEGCQPITLTGMCDRIRNYMMDEKQTVFCDTAIVSHSDIDHMSLLMSLFKSSAYKIGRLILC